MERWGSQQQLCQEDIPLPGTWKDDWNLERGKGKERDTTRTPRLPCKWGEGTINISSSTKIINHKQNMKSIDYGFKEILKALVLKDISNNEKHPAPVGWL